MNVAVTWFVVSGKDCAKGADPVGRFYRLAIRLKIQVALIGAWIVGVQVGAAVVCLPNFD